MTIKKLKGFIRKHQSQIDEKIYYGEADCEGVGHIIFILNLRNGKTNLKIYTPDGNEIDSDVLEKEILREM